ncbi:HNH endonuclease [Roseovarius mucosus]|uniref:HNH endonuclease n=1 Tax=Roseovarius mucosus TaxID=215743 RepID=UPI0035CF96EF
MTRRNMTPARRLRIFTAAGGVCHICGGKIDATREKWDADHVIALEISGDDSDDNLRPAHERCHRGAGSKTSEDQRIIAKAKRIEAKHKGAKKATRKMPYRRFDGTPVYPK